MEAVAREVIVPARPAEVWPVLTEAEELSAWFGAEAEIDVQPGGRGIFRWPDGTERRAVVEDVEPERRLAFRWLPFARTAAGAIAIVPASRVEITLEAVPAGTRVRVVEESAALRAEGRQPAARPPLALIGS